MVRGASYQRTRCLIESLMARSSPALLPVYAVENPVLLFSKPTAAYLSGVFWTTFTGGRVVSILVTIFFDIKQLLTLSHALVLCASGESAEFRSHAREDQQITRAFKPRFLPTGALIALNDSIPCTWVGVAVMGLGVSSMYGAASGLVLQYFHVRHVHVSVILVLIEVTLL